MTVVHAHEVQPESIAPRRTRYLAYTDDLMVTVIDFDDGPAAEPDPPHSHPHRQVTYVAEGELLFFIDGEPHRLGPGDLITIPANAPHTVQILTAHARLVDTFTPIRPEFLPQD
ncbi:MAG TPA: cupin domain-containing protein [Aggregatilinea sp.]|jgi:quercetin dioxygenase-like cupin family protein|uniref:cupin domain-containing protein n=1 Tax=Aggregatilinea sp. TaxID=2806333 RepID=UPI002B98E1D2|nr:cupin domain-containing protein [Aggregatilinea sp.]HML20566.1 cupin domain-containing protein [Aggregatilinea sp.]